ncbi:hypothetical protein AB4Z25_24805 [Rhizobium sp. RAF36]|uniref:hypothetical protein n=1 Tax=Rhizobium sp. RAF36 TaxID=3233055 RepID=UPI003F96426E
MEIDLGADYHLAIHQADWPTIADVNLCLTGLDYPVRVVARPPSEPDKTLRVSGDVLNLLYQGAPVEVETSIIQLSAKESFAYAVKEENGQTVLPNDMNDLIPLD